MQKITRKVVAVNYKGRRIGEGHPRTRWSEHLVNLVLGLREEGLGYDTISAKLDIPKSTVRNFCTGRCRVQIPTRHKIVPA